MKRLKSIVSMSHKECATIGLSVRPVEWDDIESGKSNSLFLNYSKNLSIMRSFLLDPFCSYRAVRLFREAENGEERKSMCRRVDEVHIVYGVNFELFLAEYVEWED